MKMKNKYLSFYNISLHGFVIMFTLSFLMGCASNSKLSMDSVGETNKPIKKVIIGSRSMMSLKYRELHQGSFISVIKEVLDQHNIDWVAAKSPREVIYAYKRKKLSHSLMITTKNHRTYSRNGRTPKLDSYTIKLLLKDLKDNSDVWEAEFVNSEADEDVENDKTKMKQLITDHFIQAGIISAIEQLEEKAG